MYDEENNNQHAQRFSLRAKNNGSSNKSLVFLKLTDSALNALDDYSANKVRFVFACD